MINYTIIINSYYTILTIYFWLTFVVVVATFTNELFVSDINGLELSPFNVGSLLLLLLLLLLLFFDCCCCCCCVDDDDDDDDDDDVTVTVSNVVDCLRFCFRFLLID